MNVGATASLGAATASATAPRTASTLTPSTDIAGIPCASAHARISRSGCRVASGDCTE